MSTPPLPNRRQRGKSCAADLFSVAHAGRRREDERENHVVAAVRQREPELQLLYSLGEQGTLAAASAVDEGFRQPYVATASSLEENEGRSNIIADIDLNALIVEDHSSLSLDEYNPPISVESDSLIVCNVRSSSFDGDHDDIPDAIKEDSSIPGSYV
nr:hypothetical protein Iba_chr15cCG8890 [Ipomoea batatas]